MQTFNFFFEIVIPHCSSCILLLSFVNSTSLLICSLFFVSLPYIFRTHCVRIYKKFMRLCVIRGFYVNLHP